MPFSAFWTALIGAFVVLANPVGLGQAEAQTCPELFKPSVTETSKSASTPAAGLIPGPRFDLRPLESSDREALMELWSIPAVREMAFEKDFLRPDSLRGVFRDAQSQPRKIGPIEEFDQRRYYYVIVKDGKLIGTVTLHQEGESRQGRRVPSRFSIGYTVHPSHWNLGIATEATRTILDRAFRDGHGFEVNALVYRNNDNSARVLEKLGFEETSFSNPGHVREFILDRSTWESQKHSPIKKPRFREAFSEFKTQATASRSCS